MAEVQQPALVESQLPRPEQGLGMQGHITNAEYQTAVNPQQLTILHEPRDRAHLASVRAQIATEQRLEQQAQTEATTHSEATKNQPQETGTNARNETSTVQSESKPSQPRAEEQSQQAFRLVTGEGKGYTLNLSANATLEEVQAKLQAEGATDLARFLDRFIFVPEGKTVRAADLQEVAQSYTTERMQKYERAGQSGKLFPYKVTSKDGRAFTLQLPKYPTIHDIRRAKQEQGIPVKQDEVEVIVPHDKTLTEATRDLLLVDIADTAEIPEMLKDIWKALRKGFKQSTRRQDEETNEK